MRKIGVQTLAWGWRGTCKAILIPGSPMGLTARARRDIARSIRHARRAITNSTPPSWSVIAPST
jgi:hypothetical protein